MSVHTELPLLFCLGLIIVMLSLAGSLRFPFGKSQRVINCSARLIFRTPKSAHIGPSLFDLHWLPISRRIEHKIALICFHTVSVTAPPYLSELLYLYSPSRSLRSASDIPCSKDGQEDLEGEILSIQRTCDLELSSCLCQAFVFTLLLNKTKNPSRLLAE